MGYVIELRRVIYDLNWKRLLDADNRLLIWSNRDIAETAREFVQFILDRRSVWTMETRIVDITREIF